jgi:hypothetical protein
LPKLGLPVVAAGLGAGTMRGGGAPAPSAARGPSARGPSLRAPSTRAASF